MSVDLRAVARQLRRWLFLIGLCVAGLLMIGLIIVGFAEVGLGILAFFGVPGPVTSGASAEAATISHVLKGLEFLFLAPLTFLVFYGIEAYLKDYVVDDEGRKKSGFFLRLKASVVGLMIAVIATDLVSRTIGKEDLTYDIVTTRSIAIVVLGLYYSCLEFWSTRH